MRRFLSPGGWPWLLALELRMLWRSFGVRSRIIAALGIVFIALAHVGGYIFVRNHVLQTLVDRTPSTAILVTAVVVLLVLSSAFGLAVRILLERGDVEMLMASPIPITTIYGVRGLAVAVASVGSMAVFLLPFANMGPFVGEWRTLGAWPALAALGLACAAIALATTLALVRWLGLRRARVVSQLLGAVVGIGFVFAMQLQAVVPARWRHGVLAWAQSESREGWLSRESPLLWPMRAFMGEAGPLAIVVIAGLAAFVAVSRGTQGVFLRAVQDAPLATSARKQAGRAATQRPFRTGPWRVTLAKELVLIRRDPALIGRALLQVLYLVPLFVLMVQRGQAVQVVAAGLLMLSSSLAGTLAWIAVSGEEAPDLLRAAPVDLERLRWLKVAAALIPVGALAMPFLAWFAYTSIPSALVVAAFLSLALASSAVVQVWSTPLGAGRDLRQRYRQNPFVGIADAMASFAWAGACWLAFFDRGWMLLAMAVACIAPAAAWFSGRRKGD
jgi:ABC-2 type transport system permease protein